MLVLPLVPGSIAAGPAEAMPFVGTSELFAVNVDDAGFVAVHALNPWGGYQQFLLHTKTPLTAPGADRGNWVYKFADYNGDRITDLYAIERNEAGMTAVHVLDGLDDYHTELISTTTMLGATPDPSLWTLDVADFNADGRADIFAINRNDNGHTAVHVMDAASGFQTYLLQTLTPLTVTTNPVFEFGVADFNADHRADLFMVNRNDNGRTAVHVLDGYNSYQVFNIQTLTPMADASDPNWVFDEGDYNYDGRADLYAIYKNDNGTTAAHVLDGSHNFQVYSLHIQTALGRTDSPNWDVSLGIPGIAADNTQPHVYARTSNQVISVVDQNITGGGDHYHGGPDAYSAVIDLKKVNHPDVIALQEVCQSQFDAFPFQGSYEADFDAVKFQSECGGGPGANHGNLIAVNKDLSPSHVRRIPLCNGANCTSPWGMVCLDFTKNIQKVRACSTHISTGTESSDQILQIKGLVNGWIADDVRVIVAGDFNLQPTASAIASLDKTKTNHPGNAHLIEADWFENRPTHRGNSDYCFSPAWEKKFDYVFFSDNLIAIQPLPLPSFGVNCSNHRAISAQPTWLTN